MRLSIDSAHYISDILPTDKAAYVELLRERQIHDQTLAIPFPYTEADADWWISEVAKTTAKLGGRSINWAIRRSDNNSLIGGIGFHDFEMGESHSAEIGYWLAKPYWNLGIMSAAVRAVAEYGFKEFGLARIEAPIFHFNGASGRVLEKAGFQFEGRLRLRYKKNGQLFDGKLYARVAEDVSVNQNRQRTFSGAPWESQVGYCRAIRVGGTIAVTGTAAVSDDGSVYSPGKPYEQAKRCLEIIEKAIQPLGAARSDIVRTRIFVTDISQWSEIGRAHGEFFARHPPTTTMVEVKSLIHPDMLVEIEADAIL